MKKLLNISEILFYYDLPMIFLAKDNVGIDYLCMLVNNEDQTYISTSISQNRLTSFINGVTDLLDIFVNPETNEWFYFQRISENIEAMRWQEKTLPDDYLPERGFILNYCTK